MPNEEAEKSGQREGKRWRRVEGSVDRCRYVLNEISLSERNLSLHVRWHFLDMLQETRPLVCGLWSRYAGRVIVRATMSYCVLL